MNREYVIHHLGFKIDLSGIPDHVREAIKNCLSETFFYGKKALAAYRLNEEWTETQIEFEEAYKVITYFCGDAGTVADINAIEKLEQACSFIKELQLKFVQKFLPEINNLNMINVQKLAIVFGYLKQEARQKIVTNSLNNSLQMIERLIEGDCFYLARDWIDRLKDENQQKILHNQVDEICAEKSLKANGKLDGEERAHRYANAIRNPNLRAQIKTRLPKLHTVMNSSF